MRRQAAIATLLWFVAVTGWMSLWALTNPIGAAPDEPSHYAKAVAAGQGDLRGNPVPVEIIRSFGVFNEDAIRQVRNSYRSFLLAADVRTTTAPPCTAFRVDLDGRCLGVPVDGTTAVSTDTGTATGTGTGTATSTATGTAAGVAAGTADERVESIVGAYPPWLYLPGGLASRFADSVDVAYLVTRLSSAAICAGLLAAACWLLVAGRARQAPVLIAGLALGCTPMTVFLASSTGASGPEAVGAVASAAAALRLSARDHPTRATWLVAGAVMAVTAASRPFAPLWVTLAVAVALSRLGWRGFGRRLRDGAAAAAAAVAAVLVGAAGSLVWTQSMALRMPLSLDRLDDGLARAVEIVPAMAGQAVGVLGWQELPLPTALRWSWVVAVVAAVIAAVVRGRRRDAAATVVSVSAATAVYLLLAGTVFYQNGLGMQGRYILPALAMVPVVAAAAVADPRPRQHPARRRRAKQPTAEPQLGVPRRPTRRGVPAYLYRAAPDRAANSLVPALAAVVVALAGVAQAVAWAVNARRYAVGVDGELWFPATSDPAWSPAGGWLVWFGAACLLLLLGVASGAVAASSARAARYAMVPAPTSPASADGGQTPDDQTPDDSTPSDTRPGTPLRMPPAVSTGTPTGQPGRPPDPRSAPPGARTSRRRQPRWTPIPLPPKQLPPKQLPLKYPPPGQAAGDTAPRPEPADPDTSVPAQPANTVDLAGDLAPGATADQAPADQVE